MNTTVHYSFAGDEIASNRAMSYCGVRLPSSYWPVAIRAFVALCLSIAVLAHSIDLIREFNQIDPIHCLRTQHSFQHQLQVSSIPVSNSIEIAFHASPIYPTASIQITIILPLQCCNFQQDHSCSKNGIFFRRALVVLQFYHSALFWREIDALDVSIISHALVIALQGQHVGIDEFECT